MSQPPDRPKIYHITHISNLATIIARGELLSDSQMLAQGGPPTTIGMSTIKQRRLTLPVKCHPGTMVGDCVPFYFCPRSIMLYIIYMANNPDLSYRGGQDPIVHLEADLTEVITWANAANRLWAISLSNAGAAYTAFRNTQAGLAEVNWEAVAALDFRPSEIKEGKQAEFLLNGSLPWSLVTRVGVRLASIQTQAQTALARAKHQPPVEIKPAWYY